MEGDDNRVREGLTLLAGEALRTINDQWRKHRTWIRPDYHTAAVGWTDPEKSYDEGRILIPGTKAWSDYMSGADWSNWIFLFLNADISCDKVAWCKGGTSGSLWVEVMIAKKDLTDSDIIFWGQGNIYPWWQEQSFPERLVGVVRYRFFNPDWLTGHIGYLWEFCFWEVPPPPAGGVTGLYFTFARPPA